MYGWFDGVIVLLKMGAFDEEYFVDGEDELYCDDLREGNSVNITGSIVLGYNIVGMLERNEGDADDTLLSEEYEGIELWKLVGIVVDSTVGKIVGTLIGDGLSVRGKDNVRLGLSKGKAFNNDGEAERPT